MGFTTIAERTRAIAPCGSLMKTPAHLGALVYKPINRMKYVVISDQERVRRRQAAINAILVSNQRENARRSKLDKTRIAQIRNYQDHPSRARRLIFIYCEVAYCSFKRILSASRDRGTVRNRHIIIWILKKNTDLSLSALGRIIGGRDHSTVLHGLRKIEGTPTLMELAKQIERAVLWREAQKYGGLSLEHETYAHIEGMK